jgi:Uma2 family endonuclease
MPSQLKEAPTAAARHSLGRMSYAHFLELDGENPHLEWVDGEVIAMPPVSLEHSSLNVFLLKIVDEYVAVKRLGKVQAEPFQMKTGPNLPGRAPDILFVAKRNVRRLKKTYLSGPADLVIEIISPGTEATDRGEKFYEYEAGGVREYWLVDPIRKRAEFYRRDRAGLFRLVEVGSDGVYQSQVIRGLWIKVDWLWRNPLPTVTEVLRAWKMTP